MQNTALKSAPGTLLDVPATTKQVRYGDPVYNDVMHFLIEEANLLDEGLFGDWLKLLDADVMVTMPTRQSVHRAAGRGFSSSMVWMRDDMASLTFKANRLGTENAFAEDPPSRTRRIVSGLRLFETAEPGRYLAQNTLLLRRTRGDAHASDELSARREDIVRRDGTDWKLARRTLFVDQTVLGTPNLALFL